MKKILWFSFLLGFVFLWGCATTNKLSQNELFARRVECDNLKEKIREENEEISSDGVYIKRVDDVFYSPQRQSCLYVLVTYYNSYSKLSESYWLYDYFTKAYIDNCVYGKNSKDDYRTDEFWDTVKELKDE